MTDLAKSQLGLVWTTGNLDLIKDFPDKIILRKILSEKLYQAIGLFTKETPLQSVQMMIGDILEDYQHDQIGSIIGAIDSIRKGQFKVYGLVTPNTIREAITIELEKVAIEREREHERNKGGDPHQRGTTNGEPATNAIQQIREMAKKIKVLDIKSNFG